MAQILIVGLEEHDKEASSIEEALNEIIANTDAKVIVTFLDEIFPEMPKEDSDIWTYLPPFIKRWGEIVDYHSGFSYLLYEMNKLLECGCLLYITFNHIKEEYPHLKDLKLIIKSREF